jgi:hypothetical protein
MAPILIPLSKTPSGDGEKPDHYMLVYDAVYDALDYESIASIEDAVDTAIEAWEQDQPRSEEAD